MQREGLDIVEAMIASMPACVKDFDDSKKYLPPRPLSQPLEAKAYLKMKRSERV